MKRYRKAMVVCAVVFTIAVSCGANDRAVCRDRKEVTCMGMKEFREKLKNPKALVVRFEGPPQESQFTKKRYVHYETVASWGGANDDATWRVLYHTGDTFIIRCGDQSVEAAYTNIRMRLSSSFRKAVTKGDAAARGALADILEGGVERAVLSEYGLEAGRDYHAAFTVESYHLPPRGPGERPPRREKVVITVSDRPLPNDLPLTPVYRMWSY